MPKGKNQKFIKVSRQGSELISSAQLFTNSWVAVGEAIHVLESDLITFWLKMTANNSLNMQFKIVLMMEVAGDEYSVPIYSTDPSKVRYRPQYYELDMDGVDTNIVERWDVSEAQFVKLYIKAGTVGATAGQVESVYYDLATAAG